VSYNQSNWTTKCSSIGVWSGISIIFSFQELTFCLGNCQESGVTQIQWHARDCPASTAKIIIIHKWEKILEHRLLFIHTKLTNIETSKRETLSLPYINGSFFGLKTRWWGSITRFIRLRITRTTHTHTEHLVKSRENIAQNYSSLKIAS